MGGTGHANRALAQALARQRVMFEANQRLHDFLASAPDPTLIVDQTGTILFASMQMEPVFGYKPHELSGARIESLMPERFRKGHTSFFKSYFSTPNPRPMGAGLDLYALHKDGRKISGRNQPKPIARPVEPLRRLCYPRCQ
jgi:PAS domain S-box-containing protein